MWTSKIRELVKLVEELENIGELEVSVRGLHVLIRKDFQKKKRVEEKIGEDDQTDSPLVSKYRLILAPHDGKFSYLEKGKTPLVEVGGRVEAKQTVAAIIVNDANVPLTIKSKYAGTIAKMFVEEGAFVRKDQILYRVKLGS